MRDTTEVPIEPDPTPWELPSREQLRAWPVADDLVGAGADLEPGTVLAAYRRGMFPMPQSRDQGLVGWWCPVRRGVLPLHGLHVSRSLRRSLRGFEIRIDTAFEEVIDACADPARPHGWIDSRIRAAYPGETWDRLVDVKRRYDPTNLFRLNHNIAPS